MEYYVEIMEFIAENAIEVIVGFCTIVTLIFTRGKKKTVKQLKKEKAKQLEKLKAKTKKLTAKLKANIRLEEEIAQEVDNT